MSPRSSVAKTSRSARVLFLRALYYLFLTGAACGLGYAAFVFADSHAYQALEQSRFERVTQTDVGQTEARAPVVEGGTLGELEVPRLGLKVTFVQGDSPRFCAAPSVTFPIPRCLGNRATSFSRDTATLSFALCGTFDGGTRSHSKHSMATFSMKWSLRRWWLH